MPVIVKNRTYLAAACLIAVLFLAGPANAHYLWVVAQGDRYRVARGTVPDVLEAYAPDRVTFIRAFDADGDEIATHRVDEKTQMFFRAERPVAMVAVRCDWGSRVQTTRGKKLLSRAEAEKQGFKVLQAFVSTQTSKTLFEDGKGVCNVLGLPFELAPRKSPLQIAPGGTLAVQLLFEGAPLPHAAVSSDSGFEAQTDENGIAQISGFHEGWNTIMAKRKAPVPNDPGLDYHKFMTFLVFRVQR